MVRQACIELLQNHNDLGWQRHKHTTAKRPEHGALDLTQSFRTINGLLAIVPASCNIAAPEPLFVSLFVCSVCQMIRLSNFLLANSANSNVP